MLYAMSESSDRAFLAGTDAAGLDIGLITGAPRMLRGIMAKRGGALELVVSGVLVAKTEPDGAGGWRIVDVPRTVADGLEQSYRSSSL